MAASKWTLLSFLVGLAVANSMRSYHVTFLGLDPSFVEPASPGTFIFHVLPDVVHPYISFHVGNSDCTVVETSSNVSDIKVYLVDNVSENCTDNLTPVTGVTSAAFRIDVDSNVISLMVVQNGVGDDFEAYLAIPDEHLGIEYYVLTYCALGGFCQVAITPSTDNTLVTMTFRHDVTMNNTCINGVPLNDIAVGTSVSFTLNEFDVLHIETTEDLTGTHIFANYDVIVIAGSRDVPSQFVDQTASLIEQLPPVNKWGTEFVVVSNPQIPAGDTVKIVGSVHHTHVTVTGYPPIMLAKPGDYVERRIDWGRPVIINASFPVLVMQIMALDVYNTSADVMCIPSMTLVPDIARWTTGEKFFPCVGESDIENGTFVVAVSNESLSNTTFEQTHMFTSPAGYNYWVGQKIWNTGEIDKRIELVGASAVYGFCKGGSVHQLAVDWHEQVQGCVASVGWPGDDIDNDCDGELDEDACEEADRGERYILSQNGSGVSNIAVATISGLTYIPFNVAICNDSVIHVKLTTDLDDHFVSIVISNSSIQAQICSPDCNENVLHQTTQVRAGCEPVPFLLMLSDVGIDTLSQALLCLQNGVSSLFNRNTSHVTYRRLLATSFVGQAELIVDVMQKDCGPMYSGQPDYFGRKFIAPAMYLDDEFSLFLTSKDSGANVTFSQTNVVMEIPPSSTKILNEVYFMGTYTGIVIFSTADISVFVYRRFNNKVAATRILPLDVWHSQYNSMFKNYGAYLCDVYTTTDLIHWPYLSTPVSDMFSFTNFRLHGEPVPLPTSQPSSVLCNDYMIAPRRTFGRHFYVPAFDLASLRVHMDLVVTSSEDNTVLRVYGEYHRQDVLVSVGDGLVRNLTTNTTYEIISTRPVQVHLNVAATDFNSHVKWQTTVVIPPVAQYLDKHVFPNLTKLNGFVASYGVDNDGNTVSPLSMPTSLFWKTYEYPKPTFTLTFINVNLYTTGGPLIVVPSDVKFDIINEVCRVNHSAVPGDGEDNDCDGLVDEETCTDDVISGGFDTDIDGAINEDCSTGNITDVKFTFDLPVDESYCVLTTTTTAPGTTNVYATTTAVLVTSGPSSNQSSPQILQDTSPSFGTVNAGVSSMPVIEVSSVSNETCSSECLCPCGWVNPPLNYTAEELQFIVRQIQLKLRISKEHLSATIRTKTSAPDDRRSATAVGYISLVFLGSFLCVVVLLDIATISRDLQQLRENISHFVKRFQK